MSTTTAFAVAKENENALVQEIPLDRIRPSDANPRRAIDATSLAELAASIELHGVLQPILVRPAPTFWLRDHLWRAAMARISEGKTRNHSSPCR